MRIEGLARARGIDLRWQPFLLGPIFREQGWSDSPFNVYPVKGQHMWRDLQRICGDIADPEVLARCLAGLVEDPAATLAAAGDGETKARLRQHNERAKALGIFGSPSFVVGGELFWGNDRLEAAFDWSQKELRSG